MQVAALGIGALSVSSVTNALDKSKKIKQSRASLEPKLLKMEKGINK